MSLFINPALIFNTLEENIYNNGLYFAAIGVRLVLGTLLISAADDSRHPLLLKILGIASVLTALTFLVMGQKAFIKLITRLLSSFGDLSALSAVLSIALGAFIIYTFNKGKNETT